MMRYLYLLGGVSLAAIGWAEYMTSDAGRTPVLAEQSVETPRTVARAQEPAPEPIPLSGVERVRSDARGHYVGRFRLNGVPVQGMIDTGATTIAINETTARRAGIVLTRNDYIYPVETANGQVMAARAMLDDVTIGTIRVRDVPAMVIDDRALGMVLIGMSFMQRLRGFSYENGVLVLRR